VRSGVEVDVSVVDVTGALLHGPGLPAAES
jgi:hypothetical protein